MTTTNRKLKKGIRLSQAIKEQMVDKTIDAALAERTEALRINEMKFRVSLVEELDNFYDIGLDKSVEGAFPTAQSFVLETDEGPLNVKFEAEQSVPYDFLCEPSEVFVNLPDHFRQAAGTLALEQAKVHADRRDQHFKLYSAVAPFTSLNDLLDVYPFLRDALGDEHFEESDEKTFNSLSEVLAA